MKISVSVLLSLFCVVLTLRGQPLTRVAATSLRLPGEASTYSYKTEPAFGGLAFAQPVGIVFAPGELQRAFVLERAGRISVIRDTTNPSRETFLDLTGRVGNSGPDHGLLSLAFHPRFSENGYFTSGTRPSLMGSGPTNFPAFTFHPVPPPPTWRRKLR